MVRNLSMHYSNTNILPLTQRKQVILKFVFCHLLFFLLCPPPPRVAFAQVDSVFSADATPVFDSLTQNMGSVCLDSSRIKLLYTEIQKAQLRVTQTSFWYRLIPNISFSANFGIKDILFVDPNTFAQYLLPKDAYRFSINLSVNEIFDFTKHTEAVLNLEKLKEQYARAQLEYLQNLKTIQSRLSAMRELLIFAIEELKMNEDILRYNTLRFEQGKIDYDAYLGSKLDVLNVRKNLLRLNQEIFLLKFKSIGEYQP